MYIYIHMYIEIHRIDMAPLASLARFERPRLRGLLWPTLRGRRFSRRSWYSVGARSEVIFLKQRGQHLRNCFMVWCSTYANLQKDIWYVSMVQDGIRDRRELQIAIRGSSNGSASMLRLSVKPHGINWSSMVRWLAGRTTMLLAFPSPSVFRYVIMSYPTVRANLVPSAPFPHTKDCVPQDVPHSFTVCITHIFAQNPV